MANYARADGLSAGFIGAVTDITKRQEAEAEHARLAAIVTWTDDAIIGKNLAGIITDWDPAVERLYGYAATDIRGKSALVLATPEHQVEISHILEKVRRKEGAEDLSTVRVHKDGTHIEVSITVPPIRDGGARSSGVPTLRATSPGSRGRGTACKFATKAFSSSADRAVHGFFSSRSVEPKGEWAAKIFDQLAPPRA
jgi:PAS domain S-box-containing protein